MEKVRPLCGQANPRTEDSWRTEQNKTEYYESQLFEKTQSSDM